MLAKQLVGLLAHQQPKVRDKALRALGRASCDHLLERDVVQQAMRSRFADESPSDPSDLLNSIACCVQAVLERLRMRRSPTLSAVLDALDADGQSALHLASAMRDGAFSLRLSQLLLRYGANPVLRSRSGVTAETIAWTNFNFDTMRLLRANSPPSLALRTAI